MNQSSWAKLVIAFLVPIALIALADVFGLLEGYHKWRARYYILTKSPESTNHIYGVELLQYPGDLMLYEQLIETIKPDFIIEAGTWAGGSALYYSTVLEFVHPQGKVITIDIAREKWDRTLQTINVPGKEKLLGRITFVHGGSTDPETVAKVKGMVPQGSRVLVLLDSMHTHDHVLGELKAYSPLVSKDSYIIVNDTDWTGVLDAAKDYLKTTDEFVIDHQITRYFITCAESGFLKRVK